MSDVVETSKLDRYARATAGMAENFREKGYEKKVALAMAKTLAVLYLEGPVLTTKEITEIATRYDRALLAVRSATSSEDTR